MGTAGTLGGGDRHRTVAFFLVVAPLLPVEAAAQEIRAVPENLLHQVIGGVDRFAEDGGTPPVMRAIRVDPETGEESLVGFVFHTADVPPHDPLADIAVPTYHGSQRSRRDPRGVLGRPGRLDMETIADGATVFEPHQERPQAACHSPRLTRGPTAVDVFEHFIAMDVTWRLVTSRYEKSSMPKDALNDIELLIRSRYGLIYLDTSEEDRANVLLQHVADRLRVPLFTWTRSQGLSRADLGDMIYESPDATKAVQHVIAARQDAVYHFRSFAHTLAGNDLLTSPVRDATRSLEQLKGSIVLTGEGVDLPGQLKELAAHVTLPGPSDDEFRELLASIVQDISKAQHVEVALSREETTHLVQHLSGLTLMEAEKILTKAIIEDGALSSQDIEHVIEAKRRVVEREGLLEYYPASKTMASVADLVALKAWLAKRKAVVKDSEGAEKFGLTFPRGVLLLGVPGCGKSLSAKAVASEWGLPLLKLDPSNLYNKYIGESESNFKRAMRAAERMAPVVLWIDELEKAFASGGGGDGGVSQRILGSFLSWMQERHGDVFVVATANDIQSLPPEFLRKGRFDEIFFVDLPDQETREQILQIHLDSRGHDASGFDLVTLATQTDGFSGSELEEVVVSALYTTFSNETALDTAALGVEIVATKPLSVTMGEKIQKMRDWAKERAVRAN